MKKKGFSVLLSQSLNGYRGAGNTALIILFFLLAAVFCSVVIVYPFWWTAVNHPQIFTIVAVTLILGAAAAAIIYRFFKSKSKKVFLKNKAISFLMIVVKILVPAALIYLGALLIYKKMWPLSIPIFIITIILIGIFINGKKNKFKI